MEVSCAQHIVLKFYKDFSYYEMVRSNSTHITYQILARTLHTLLFKAI